MYITLNEGLFYSFLPARWSPSLLSPVEAEEEVSQTPSPLDIFYCHWPALVCLSAKLMLF